MDKKPLLSICIPTYNRSQYLKKSLESLAMQPEFDSECIEVIILDNASTDNTQEVVESYQQNYSNIFYYKNSSNIQDRNFPSVIAKAHGEYRKLYNDTVLYGKGSLAYLIDLIKQNITEKPCLFFLNNKKNDVRKHAATLEDFLYSVSFNVTWIGGFGLWEKDCVNIEKNIYGCDLHLWQVPFLLSTVYESKSSVVVMKKLITTQIISKKNLSYGLYQVFYKNYLGFIEQYMNGKIISEKCYYWLEKDLLFNFFAIWIIIYELQREKYLVAKENLKDIIFDKYRDKPYFLFFLLYYYFNKLKCLIKMMIKKCLPGFNNASAL